MLLCFALGSNVSTLMTVQWCKLSWGQCSSMSCEMFLIVVNWRSTHLAGSCLLTQLIMQDGCDLLSIGCHPFLQVSRVWHTIPSNWGDVCLLHHFYRVHCKSLQAYASRTQKCGLCYCSLAAHHLHHSFILALSTLVLNCTSKSLIFSYFKNAISCNVQLLVGLH
jgi:hypothetical protein